MTEIVMPKTKKGQETFNEIVHAAEQCFSKQGYYKATIKDITQEAGVGLGTFYLYFPNKISCYRYLLQSYSLQIRKTISKRIRGLTSRRDIEKIGLMVFLEIVRDKQYIYNIIWEALMIDRGLFEDYYQTFAEHYIRRLQDGQDEGSVVAGDTEVLSYMLIGIANFVGLRYSVFSKEEDLEQTAEKVIRFLENGIFTTKN